MHQLRMNFAQFSKRIISNDKKFLLFVGIFAFILRFIFLLSIEDGFYFTDTVYYEDCAKNILNGEGFGDYRKAPLYPLWISAVYSLTGGRNVFLLRLAEVVLSTLLCVILFYIAKRIFNRSIGITTSLIAAIFPMFIFLPVANYPTLLSTFLVTSGVYLTLLLENSDRKLLPIFIGCLFGLSALAVAPTATLIVPVIVWVLAHVKLKRKQSMIQTVLILSSFVLVLTPWTYRNYTKYHKLIPIRHDAAFNMPIVRKLEERNRQKSSNRVASTSSNHTTSTSRQIQAAPTQKKRISSILKDPATLFLTNSKQFFSFWQISPEGTLASAEPNHNLKFHEKDKRIAKTNIFSISQVTYLISKLSYGPVLFFAFIGLLLIRKHFHQASLLIFTILTLALTYSFFWAKLRYRIPIEPLIVVMAAYGLIASFEKIRALSLKLLFKPGSGYLNPADGISRAYTSYETEK